MSNPTANGPQWVLDSQTPVTRANSTGRVEDGYDIAFSTASGHNGVVFVPKSRYNLANVKALIQAEADQVDAVGQLTADTEV